MGRWVREHPHRCKGRGGWQGGFEVFSRVNLALLIGNPDILVGLCTCLDYEKLNKYIFINLK